MIITLFIILAITSYLLGLVIQKKINMRWALLNHFLFLSFFIGYCMLEYGHVVNFTLYILFVSIVTMGFFLYNITFSPLNSTNFLIWFMFVLSILTFSGMISSIYYYIKIKNSEALIGDKGEEGKRGEDGDVLDSNLNSCYNQLNYEVEKTIQNWKKEQNIEFDENTDYFNNLYFKRKIKSICKSQKYSMEHEKMGRYDITIKLKNKIKEWTNLILGYKNGLRFLQDHFLIDYHFKEELLNKIKNETISPFDIIKEDTIWNWK